MDNVQSIPVSGDLMLRTQHVRVRITQQDLDATRKSHVHTDRTNAVARAINRTLRDGYEATFDGLSVGIIKTKSSDGSKLSPPSWDCGSNLVYEESGGMWGPTAFVAYRLLDNSEPFFRGVDKRVQKIHTLNSAHRKTKPARVTVSLPVIALKRTASEQQMDELA